MSKRLFFNCPLVAMYMAKNFGVKFTDADIARISKYMSDRLSSETLQVFLDRNIKIYVSPESEHIFNYQIGDRVAYMGDIYGKLVEGDDVDIKNQEIGIDRVKRRTPKAIIEFRNGKQF